MPVARPEPTEKQKAFADYLLTDKEQNATKAALHAYPKLSEKAAASAGSRLLTNVKVQSYLARKRSERSERTKIDADWLLKRLAAEAEADLADLYFDSGALKPVSMWPEIWRKGLVAGVDVEQLHAYKDGQKVPDGVVTKIKLSDRVKRLELIGKHVDVKAWEKDSPVISTTNNIMPVPTADSVEDWEKAAQRVQDGLQRSS